MASIHQSTVLGILLRTQSKKILQPRSSKKARVLSKIAPRTSSGKSQNSNIQLSGSPNQAPPSNSSENPTSDVSKVRYIAARLATIGREILDRQDYPESEQAVERVKELGQMAVDVAEELFEEIYTNER